MLSNHNFKLDGVKSVEGSGNENGVFWGFRVSIVTLLG